MAGVPGPSIARTDAIWGNYLPKQLSPWSLEDEPFDWQRVHRFCGWVASLSGIALVMVWLVLPLDGAKRATAGILLAFVVLCLARKLISLATHSPPRPNPTASAPGTGGESRAES